jgi:hypothetical protein
MEVLDIVLLICQILVIYYRGVEDKVITERMNNHDQDRIQ